jgi:acyl-CoA thioesterase-1
MDFAPQARSTRLSWRRLLPALVMTAVAGACTTSPTSPSASDAAGALTVGVASEGPVSVPNAIVPTPPQALGATRFLAFGDSITYGALSEFDGGFIVLDAAGSYPRLLQSMLNQFNAPQTFAMQNAGLPGETARAGIDRLPGVLATHRPQVVLLLEGINDLNFDVSVNQTAANVRHLVDIARLFNCTVLVATMPQTYHSVDPNTGRVRENSTEEIVPFNNEVRRLVAGMQNVHIVDIYAAFGSNRSLMGNDGLHPSPAGYQVMAQQFHAAISSIFPVRGGVL